MGGMWRRWCFCPVKKDGEKIDKINVDKEDVTERATYQKIKGYVKEMHGLNVHTKYIAEVKQKHGAHS